MRRSPTMLLALPVTLAVGLLLVFVWPVPNATFTFGSLGTLADGGGMPVLLVVTPTKVVGAVLVWVATVISALALGRRRADRLGATAPRPAPILLAAGALVAVGLLLVLVWPQSEAWFTYGSFTTFDEPGDEPSLLVLTTVEIVGALLVWAGTLLVGYLGGRRPTGLRHTSA